MVYCAQGHVEFHVIHMDVTMSSTSNTSNAFVLGSIFNPTCVYLQTNKHVTKRSLTLQLYASDSDFPIFHFVME